MKRTVSVLVICLFMGTIFGLVPANVQGANPVLSNYGHTPNQGSFITVIDMYLTGTDADNDPLTAWVVIDLVTYAMIENDTTDVTTTDGKTWFYEDYGYANFTHSYKFYIDDGGANVSHAGTLPFSISSGSIMRIDGSTSDGEVRCVDAVYANCLVAGAGTTVITNTVNTNLGQQLQAGSFTVLQGFYNFGTSVLLDGITINYATIYINTNGDSSATEFNVQFYQNNSGDGWFDNTSALATSDYMAQSDMATLQLEGILLNSSHFVLVDYFALNVQTTYINKTGETRYIGVSSRYGTAPVGLQYLSLHASDSAYEPYILIDYYSPSVIEITNPKAGVVYKTIDLVAKVDTPSGNEVDEVTFQISGDTTWFGASYNSDTDTYIYSSFDTRLYLNSDYTLTARVNFTNSEYSTDEVVIIIENDDEEFVGKTFPGDRTKGGVPDGSYVDPAYIIIYRVEASGSGTSVNFDDMRLGTSDTVLDDEIWVTNYVHTNRVWINTTTAILVNSTYVTYYDGGGGVELYVNCSVSVTAYRETTIRRVVEFTEWTYNTDTQLYSYSLAIENTLSYTLDVDLLYLGKEPDTFIDPKQVTAKDVTNDDPLSPGEDFAYDICGFYLMYSSQTSGTTRSFYFSYRDFVEGTDILIPTAIISEGNLRTQPANRDGKQYTLATKQITNDNDFSYSGRVIVIFDLEGTVDVDSIKVDNSDGSNYAFFPESDTRIVIQGTSFSRHESIEFFIYFNYESDDPVESMIELLIWIGIVLIGFGIACGIALLKGVKKDEVRRYVVTGGLAGVVFGILFVLAYAVLKLQEAGLF